MPSVTADDLRITTLLSHLDDSALQEIAPFVTRESYVSGRTLVREGDVEYVFYVIRSGRVAVTTGSELLRSLGPGDFFGELALMSDEGKRTATVTARGDVEVLAMLGTCFRQLQVEHPAVAGALQAAINERLSTG
jgi:CRP-like cAMP-binding protein